MKQPIEMVVTDLDGTLWDFSGEIASTTLDALEELTRREIPVVAATARAWNGIQRLYQHNGVRLPAILSNGSVGRTALGDLVYATPFSTSQAYAIMDAFESHGLSPNLYTTDITRDVVVGASPSSSPGYMDEIAARVSTADPESILMSNTIVHISVVGSLDKSAIAKSAARIQNETGAKAYLLTDDVFGGWTLNVGPPTATKWNGTKAFCEHYGADVTKVLAVGDGENDVDLLRNAPISAAMAHAIDDVLAVAGVVLAPERGWSAILDLIE